MSTITISFDVETVPDDVAIATEIVDLAGEVHWHGVAMLAATTEAENIEAGRTYIVRARFPSGFEPMAEVHLADGAGIVPIVLPCPAPPVMDDAAWAFYLQDGLAPAQTGPAIEAGAIQAWSRPAADVGAPWKEEAILLEPGIFHRRWEVRFASRTPIGGVYALLRFMDDGEPATQTWLTVGDRSFAIPHHPQATDVVIVAERGRVAVRTRNPMPDADALLSYMHYGDVKSARIVGQRLIDLLSTLHPDQRLKLLPTLNPAAAVLAGYYAIRSMPLERLPRSARSQLDERLNDVNSYSPAFPDGKVIYGWSALRSGYPVTAGRAFLFACRRGIPFYTMGVRLLFDGLRAIPDPDSEVKALLAWLVPYADRIDWTARTTAIKLHQNEPPFEPFRKQVILEPSDLRRNPLDLAREPADLIFARRDEALRMQSSEIPSSELWRVRVLPILSAALTSQKDKRKMAALVAITNDLEQDPTSFPYLGSSLQIARVEGEHSRERESFAVKFLVSQSERFVMLVALQSWEEISASVRNRYAERSIIFAE